MARSSWLINFIYLQARELKKLLANKKKKQTINRITPIGEAVSSSLADLSVTTQVGPGVTGNLLYWVLLRSCLPVLSRQGSVSVPCRTLIKIREAIATRVFRNSPLVSLAAGLRAQTHRVTDAVTIIAIQLLSL